MFDKKQDILNKLCVSELDNIYFLQREHVQLFQSLLEGGCCFLHKNMMGYRTIESVLKQNNFQVTPNRCFESSLFEEHKSIIEVCNKNLPLDGWVCVEPMENSENTNYFDMNIATEVLIKTIERGRESRLNHLTECYNLACDLLCDIELPENIVFKLLNTVLLHDIGYSSVVAVTGEHSVDGYNYINDNFSSFSFAKAILLHGDFINTCPKPYSDIASSNYDSLSNIEFAALILVEYCDSHVDGNGNRCSIQERHQDIISRYSNDLKKITQFECLIPYYYHIEDILGYILSNLSKYSTEEGYFCRVF